MSQAHRLPSGGRIDRACKVTFEWDGREFEGYAGDTVASALLANGVHLVGRSFKYHRPRGIVGAGVEEPNALLTVDGGAGRIDSNTRATTLPLTPGLTLRGQHCWPSVRFDVGAVAGLLAPLIPAGFYYKTFLWPRRAWHALYEPLIRRSAGLGPAPLEPDPDFYAQRYAHCDVLVIGAGPTGLAAALSASAGGARVILCDDQSEPGGKLLDLPAAVIDGEHAWTWLDSACAALRERPTVQLLLRTTAFSFGANNLVGLVQLASSENVTKRPVWRERLWFVRARRVILATGAIERPIVFPHNDRPGIMLASAARSYLNRYAVKVGQQAVILASHDSAYDAAIDLHTHGVPIVAIVDARAVVPISLIERAKRAGIEVLIAHVPCGSRGRMRVRSIEVCPRASDRRSREMRTLACDVVLMAGGWTPNLQLHSQSRGTTAWDDTRHCYLPDETAPNVSSAGAARGRFTLAECLQDGHDAGHVASRDMGRASVRAAPRAEIVAMPTGGSLYDNVAGAACGGPAWVDFQNDVTTRDIELAVREGFQSVEHLKRYTTLGMATDQGRTSNLHGIAIAAQALDTAIASVGHTTFRAPVVPVTFGAMVGPNRGELFDAVRRTEVHAWAERHGAVFENVGTWQRARYFPRHGESMHDAVRRECLGVRTAVGMIDASTLGKIEVVGPDATEFLNRLYVNDFDGLEVGRCRYAVMLRDDGFVFDDGVVGRLATDRYHVTTTTGGAARVLHHMENYLQTEFHDLRVWLTSITEQWVAFAVNGPLARRVLEPLVDGIDLSPAGFPYMAVRVGRIAGVPTRLFRVSFTGEVGFEVNVPAGAAVTVWEQLYTSGLPHGLVVYGTEAMHVLRAEKGYIIVGQDTDGTVTPDDVGLSWAIGRKKRDFIGKRSLRRPELTSLERLQLVGLLSADGRTPLAQGGQLVSNLGTAPLVPDGHVTSTYESAALGQPIALALLRAGRGRIGESVWVSGASRPVVARVVAPTFIDSGGERLRS